jgi:hypothetical protein
MLLAMLNAKTAEDQVSHSGGRRLVPRLRRMIIAASFYGISAPICS